MTMFPGRFYCAVLIAVLFLFSAVQPAAGQTLYGTVVGVVEDSSGGLVENVKVTVTNKGTGLTLTTQTDGSGLFTLLNVPAGTYDAVAEFPGFKTLTRTGLAVTVNTVSRLNLVMEIGAVTEQITVSAEVAQLQTDKADTHTELQSDLVKNLPLPGYRNYQSLINLVPGATPASFQNAVTDTPARSLRTNVNGTNASTNVTRIDGAASVNVWLPHHTGYVVPAEMVETVNVVTTAGDAEQGMAGGAAITLVTKSGTNTLHGSAFWFHDNQRLRARNFFFTPTTQKPVSNYNNFGATIGGPIVKNKLFYFYSYDNTKQRNGAFGRYSVPQSDIRGGDFSNTTTAIFDPLTGDTLKGTGRTQFADNVIPSSRISSIAQNIQAYYPQPNIAGAVNNYAIGGTPQFNRDYNDVKFNYNRSSNHLIWGRYGIMNAFVGGRGIFGDGVGPAPGADPGFGDTRIQNTSVGHNYTLSPNLLLDGVLGYNRLDQTVRGQDFGKDFSATLGIPGLGGPDPRQQGFPNITINGYTGFGVPGWMPLERVEESYTTTHTLRWIKGKHNIAFGFDGVLHKLTHWSPHLGFGPRGNFNFNGGVTSDGSFNNFNGYAAFLLGSPNLIRKSIQHVMLTGREYQFGWFAQDRWQVTRKLTMNAGLRYEYYPLMGRSNGKGLERLDPETNLVYLGARGDIPRDNGFSVSKKLFSPHLGLAFRLDDSTVIRSGYAMNYSPLPWSRPLQGMYPLTVSFAFPAANDNLSSGSLAEGVPPVVGPDLSSGVVALPAAADMRSPYPGQITRGYIQSWNFTLERRLPGSLVGTAAYVGTQVTHQSADRDINSGQVLGAGNAGRPYSAKFGRNIATNMWDGYLSSNYHALQTSLRGKVGGLTLQGAYTWSKAINMTDDEGWAGVSFNWEPVFGRNRATAGYDRTHVFQMGYVYELPFGPGKKFGGSGPIRHVLGGWAINGVTAAYSGTPFTPSAPGGTLNLPGNAQTPDQVKADVIRTEGIGADQTFYDRTAFAAIAAGQASRFGSMGRNSLRNPGVLRHDLMLSKDIRFFEKVVMTFRAEAYNFTNSRLSTGFASNDSTNPNFLRVLSAVDERQFRLGLRFGF
jgi:hypothetical protein